MSDRGIAFAHDEPVVTHADATTDGMMGSTLFALRTVPPGWLHDCIARIEQLRSLSANWNSYGALPIDLRSIMLAKSLLVELAFVDSIEEPTVTASPSGNVAFCWDDGERSLDVEVLPDNLLEYAYLNESQPSLDEEGQTCEVNKLAFLLTQL
jgi:hypothetical protein